MRPCKRVLIFFMAFNGVRIVSESCSNCVRIVQNNVRTDKRTNGRNERTIERNGRTNKTNGRNETTLAYKQKREGMARFICHTLSYFIKKQKSDKPGSVTSGNYRVISLNEVAYHLSARTITDALYRSTLQRALSPREQELGRATLIRWYT